MDGENHALTKNIYMNDVSDFLQSLALNKPLDVTLNNRSNIHASGKLAEYRALLNTCKFKLMAYFTVDKWGRHYTVEEKKRGMHRRPIPSVDRVRNVINEELAFNTLIDYCLKNQNKLDAAQIYLIDKIEGVEIQVFKFNAANVAASQFCEMEFRTNRYGNTHFHKLLDTPLRTDKIRNYE